jgi:uncharacterized protein
MSVWAISDLHLSLGVSSKSMEIFGPAWEKYMQKIEENWKKAVAPSDLVLVAGDLSWAMRLKEAMPDLMWLDKLPGTKVIIKGNHDYWWNSISKLREILPPSIHAIQNDVFIWQDYAIGGARLWDTPEYNFDELIHFYQSYSKTQMPNPEYDGDKIFQRELERLRTSLAQIPKNAKHKIALTHYPPIGINLTPSKASAILEEFQIQAAIFGHLHSLKDKRIHWGERNGIRYFLTSCDVVDFKPLPIVLN